MARTDQRPPRRWTPPPGPVEWRGDERAYAALLNALARDRLDAAATEREMDAAPVVSLADVQHQQKRAAQDEMAEARRELRSFRSALEDARSRGGPAGTEEVAYDSSDATQDDQADALIQYLVRTGYADVRTEEVGRGRYVYHFRIHWQDLQALAEERGHSLAF